jgi:hypothetical protein
MLDALDVIDVTAPCTASWDEMQGDETVRFCGLCRLNVYNLSAMKRDDALKLVEQREGRLCVRFYRRPDGTVVTRDGCRTVLIAARRRLARMAAGIAALLAFFVAGGLFARSGAPQSAPSRSGPLMRLANWLEPEPKKPSICPPIAGGMPPNAGPPIRGGMSTKIVGEVIMGGAPCPPSRLLKPTVPNSTP